MRKSLPKSIPLLLIVGSLFAATNSAEAQEPPEGTHALGTLKAARFATHKTWQAIDEATDRVVGWQRLPEVADYRTILDPARTTDGSRSIGTVGRGALDGGARMPDEGDHHSIIERHRGYNTSHATSELIDSLVFAAEHVGEHAPGAPLRVGNMSRPRGGDIRWSRSHNSGRDADLAFYVVDLDERSVPAPDLLQFDDYGVPYERKDLRFDVHRNWLLVRGLLENPHAEIQYLFISNGLKAMLLEHAVELREPRSLVARARKVLRQPTDALPHDDHFHLRITCPLDDRLLGCVESGPRWEWIDYHDEHLLAQALELSKALEDSDPTVRLMALEYLSSTRSPFASEVALTWGVYNDHPEVAAQALQVASWAWPWSATTIRMAQRLIETPGRSLEDRAWAYSILRRSRDPLAFDYALTRVGSEDVEAGERIYAARALGHMMDQKIVPFLIDELHKQPPRVREELATVLRRITNRSHDLDWGALSQARAEREAQAWKRWYEDLGHLGRERWLITGFDQIGVKVQELDPAAVDSLIPLLKTAPDHVVYNINRSLREMTGRWSPLESTDGRALYKSWSTWWSRNRDAVLARAKDDQENEEAPSDD